MAANHEGFEAVCFASNNCKHLLGSLGDTTQGLPTRNHGERFPKLKGWDRAAEVSPARSTWALPQGRRTPGQTAWDTPWATELAVEQRFMGLTGWFSKQLNVRSMASLRLYTCMSFPQWAMLEIHDKSFISKIFEHPLRNIPTYMS